MNIRTWNNHYLLILLALLAFSSNANADKFFRWVDESGEVHYSYTLPPSMSQNGYMKINENGRRVSVVSSADEKSKKLKASLVVENNEGEKIDPEQQKAIKKHDDYLMATYLSVDELTTAYLKKKKIFMEQIALYTSRIENLGSSLEKVTKQEKTTKNKVAKKKLQDYINVTTESINVYKEMVTENNSKLKKIEATYTKDKERLSELLSKDKEPKKKEEKAL